MGCGASSKYNDASQGSQAKDWSETNLHRSSLTRGSVILRRGNSGDLKSYYDFKSEASGTGEKDELSRKSLGCIQKTTSLASHLDSSCRRIKKERRTTESIETEIDIIRQMDHPNVAHIYETFEDDTYHSIITDHCNLGSLANLLVSRKALKATESATVLQQLGRVVIYLHDRKICHRGLRPEAIMLHTSEQMSEQVLTCLDTCTVKVIDFSHAVHFKRGKPIKGRVDTFAYSSLQLLDGECTEVCDAWSCGAILYTMLCGRPPFGGDIVEVPLSEAQVHDVKARAARGITWSADDELNISKSGRKLIQGLLHPDEEKRLKVEHIIGDRWCEEQGLDAFSHVPITIRHLENMNEFSCANPLKKIALNIIAQRLPEHEIKDLRAIFDSMDLDKNGVVTYKELKVALNDIDPCSSWRSTISYPVDPRALMNLLDTNGNMELDFTEFVAASISKSQYSNENLLHAAFKAIDTDGSGEIDIQELMDVLTEDKEASVKDSEDVAEWIKEVMAEADGDGSGAIDFEEFQELINKISLPHKKGNASVLFAKERLSSKEKNVSRRGSMSRQTSIESTKSSRSSKSNDLQHLDTRSVKSRESTFSKESSHSRKQGWK